MSHCYCHCVCVDIQCQPLMSVIDVCSHHSSDGHEETEDIAMSTNEEFKPLAELRVCLHIGSDL